MKTAKKIEKKIGKLKYNKATVIYNQLLPRDYLREERTETKIFLRNFK
jgi:hypothetical protein|tara:strand:+ start:113 stop:256 length:144 start_codon:yes stop_codon:yes gene_type:complete